MKNLLYFLITLILSINVNSQEKNLSDGPFDQLIIRGVTLINGNGSPPVGPVDIVIENNIIKSIRNVGYPGVEIAETRRPKVKKNGREIDANGMYVLPGFIDMHGHIGGRSQGAEPDYVFKLWLAHGVTTVREPGGRGIDFSIDLKNNRPSTSIFPEGFFIEDYTHNEVSNDEVLDENNVSIQSSPQEQVIEMLPGGVISMDFGVYS